MRNHKPWPFSFLSFSPLDNPNHPKFDKFVPSPDHPQCSLAASKTPSLPLQEYQSGNKDIVIDAQVSQALYVFKCDNSVITVKGRTITIKISLVLIYLSLIPSY